MTCFRPAGNLPDLYVVIIYKITVETHDFRIFAEVLSTTVDFLMFKLVCVSRYMTFQNREFQGRFECFILRKDFIGMIENQNGKTEKSLKIP